MDYVIEIIYPAYENEEKREEALAEAALDLAIWWGSAKNINSNEPTQL